MAYTAHGVNDALAVKLWSKALTVAIRENLEIAPLMGTSASSIIHVKEDATKGAGDRIRMALRTHLSGRGVSEGMTAEGNGEALTFYSDDLLINELGHVAATWSENSIDAQRVPFNMREEAKDALAEWYANRMSTAFFTHACGYTPTTDLLYTGHNAVAAPSAQSGQKRHLWTEAGATADEDLDSTGDEFSLDIIDAAVEAAKVGDNAIKPIKVNGKDMYVVYMHPYQVTSLRTNTGATQWNAIQQSALSGGDIKSNPIFSGALGVYNGCVLRSNQHVTQGVNSSSGAAITTVRRAVLLGAQAVCMGFGRKSSGNRIRWSEQLMDHERRLEVGAFQLFGMKKSQWNSNDHGTVVMSSYAVAS